MPLIYDIPMFSILLVLMSAMVIPFFSQKSWGLNLVRGVEVVVAALSAVLLVQLSESGESFTYQMGHFPAPWGNLLRCGPLEAGGMCAPTARGATACSCSCSLALCWP